MELLFTLRINIIAIYQKDNMIAAYNINKSYNGKKIIKDVSLELNNEEISVLFGPSGSGKTTLCRNLTLLEYPDSGNITIDNISYIFPSNNSIIEKPYPKINMVFQQLFLWPHLTNEQNIKIVVSNYNKEKKDRFLYLTELLKIDDILKLYPNESSVGQKQRVAIARVLMLKPEFIFFDEITSALDIVQTNNIINLLFKLKSEGIGILIITHSIYFMEKIADRLLFIADGVLVEKGNNNILKQPKTETLKQFLGI